MDADLEPLLGMATLYISEQMYVSWNSSSYCACAGWDSFVRKELTKGIQYFSEVKWFPIYKIGQIYRYLIFFLKCVRIMAFNIVFKFSPIYGEDKTIN